MAFFRRVLQSKGFISLEKNGANQLSCFSFSTSTKDVSDATLLKGVLSSRKQLDAASTSEFEALKLEVIDESVAHLKFNRPTKMNSMNMQLWLELEKAFERIEEDTHIKAVVVSGEGKCFTSGMDLNVFAQLQIQMANLTCEGRKREQLVKLIERLQKITGAPEACRVPVIAAIHGPCIGAGVDFSAACDLRYCDVSADFSVKEIDLAIVADIGTLQRFPLLVGEQRAKELSYTGRHFSGIEALKMGYVLECFADKEILVQHALDMAKMIASKSPLTIRGIKQTINYQRDHTTADSLYQIKYHNAATILSDDLVQAVTGMTTKSKPTFRQD